MKKSAQPLLSYNYTFHTVGASPQPSWLEMELQQRRQWVILVPNEVSSTHLQNQAVPSRETRAQLVTRNEIKVVVRITSGLYGYVIKLYGWKFERRPCRL